MNWADRDGEFIFPYDDHDFGRHGNEIPMRHHEAASVRKSQRERGEAVFDALFDLINHRAGKLRLGHSGGNVIVFDNLQRWPRARPATPEDDAPSASE